MDVRTIGARLAAARTTAAAACAAGLLWLGVACAGPRPLALPGQGGDPREFPGSSGDIGASATEGGVSAKRVSGKEPPTTLIAVDGTRCIVSEERYRATRIGENALCVWRSS